MYPCLDCHHGQKEHKDGKGPCQHTEGAGLGQKQCHCGEYR